MDRYLNNEIGFGSTAGQLLDLSIPVGTLGQNNELPDTPHRIDTSLQG
jgi:hypothetical protein